MARRFLSRLAAPVLVALTLAPAGASAQGGILPGNLTVVEPVDRPNIVTVGSGTTVPAHLASAFAERGDEQRQREFNEAVAAQERHTNALLKNAGTVGTAVSFAENNRAVVKVFVSDQGSAAGIPEALDGVPVVVESVGDIFALNVTCETRGTCTNNEADASAGTEPPSQQDRHPRPVPIGVSTGHLNVTAGTIGCRVSAGCHTYALSNAHVIADENSGLVGDPIIQPGVYDGGTSPADRIGFLEASVPIVMSTLPSTSNRVDAALASTTPSEVGTATRSSGYGEPKASPEWAFVGMQVMKFGRTTGQTRGYVDAVNAIVHVNYDAGTARFVDQIVIRSSNTARFSRPGDSGSLVVRDDTSASPEGPDARRPVGLLFASGDDITVANEINDVLSELSGQISESLEIDGEL